MTRSVPFKVCIPARYYSTRLPQKVILDIAGKPMIQHVYERALASGAQEVIVATDDQRIKTVVEGFGGKACLTSPEHLSGTSRIAEAISQLKYSNDTIIVNVQGDEPLMPPENIFQVAQNLAAVQNGKNIVCATLCEEIFSLEQILNPNVVKVVRDQAGCALYFSRAPIPWHRDYFSKPDIRNGQTPMPYYRHIGIYACHAGFFQRYLDWPASPLEEIESLEQLRILWHGAGIHVDVAREKAGVCVDTPQDLEIVRAILANPVECGRLKITEENWGD